MRVLKGQLWHFLLLMILLMGVLFLKQRDPSIVSGSIFGVSTDTWFILAVISPIIHQLYVVIFWRLELYYQMISNTLGEKGFLFFKIGFATLILSRPILITVLAFSNSKSLAIIPVLRFLLSGVFAVLSIYLFYSIKKYFGYDRAFGIDHFYPDETKKLPMVKQGIFKYSSNAMYVFGFLALWIPGILLQSKSALLVALFSHIYIWVHYFFTEKPDMKFIYKP